VAANRYSVAGANYWAIEGRQTGKALRSTWLRTSSPLDLAPIPDGITDEQAVYCCDMLSTGSVAAEFGNIPIGGSVAILAQGPNH
jgi:hypothetical protein